MTVHRVNNARLWRYVKRKMNANRLKFARIVRHAAAIREDGPPDEQDADEGDADRGDVKSRVSHGMLRQCGDSRPRGFSLSSRMPFFVAGIWNHTAVI